jgi:hypothetical protein
MKRSMPRLPSIGAHTLSIGRTRERARPKPGSFATRPDDRPPPAGAKSPQALRACYQQANLERAAASRPPRDAWLQGAVRIRHRSAARRVGRDQPADVDVALRDHAIERSDYLLARLWLWRHHCCQFRLRPLVASSNWNYTGAIADSSVETEFGQTAALVAWEIDRRAPCHSSRPRR